MNMPARWILAALLILPVWGSQHTNREAGRSVHSVIVEAEGVASLGDDRTRKQTEEAAMLNAKRNAAEQAATYIRSETTMKDFQEIKDLVQAYSHAKVRVLETLAAEWYNDPIGGLSYRVRIKAEVTPDEKAIQRLSQQASALLEDPNAPLSVRIWTDKPVYREGERIKIYVRANKPCYMCVVYHDVSGRLIQLLPNPYRSANYFRGSTVYEIPAAEDQFDIVVRPPFGREKLIVYASTAPLGKLELKDLSGVYEIQATSARQVEERVRSVGIAAKSANNPDSQVAAAEFAEAETLVITRREE